MSVTFVLVSMLQNVIKLSIRQRTHLWLALQQGSVKAISNTLLYRPSPMEFAFLASAVRAKELNSATKLSEMMLFSLHKTATWEELQPVNMKGNDVAT